MAKSEVLDSNDEAAKAIGPRTTILPNAADRYSKYTPLWIIWIAMFFAIEIPALYREYLNKKNGTEDRTKRTLSAHMRRWAATDSLTGIPLEVPFGKFRRFLIAVGIMWFENHIRREGEM